jgi:Family of unknown function (DUF6599)
MKQQRPNARNLLRRVTLGVLLSCLIACSFTADSLGQNARPGEPLLGLLPLETDLKGWSLDGEPQTAEGMALFDLIDGGAEEYVKAGFRRAVTATYRNKEGKRINLDIFEMLSPESATAIYRKKAGGKGNKVAVGEEAAMEDYYLNFRKAAYLVTLSGYDTQKETLEGILLMGRLVAQRIPASP